MSFRMTTEVTRPTFLTVTTLPPAVMEMPSSFPSREGEDSFVGKRTRTVKMAAAANSVATSQTKGVVIAIAF